MIKIIGPAYCSLKNRWIVFLWFALLGNGALCQTFSKDRVKFVKETKQLFTEEEMEFNVRQIFPMIVEGNSMSEGNFNKMVDGANAILTATNETQLAYLYIATFMYQAKNKFDSEFFNIWIGLEKDYRDQDIDIYSEFLQFSYGLFRHRALYKDDYSQWSFKGDLSWITDKKLKIHCSEGQLIGFSMNLKGKDSVYVQETGGIFDVTSKKFVGRNGTIDWQKVGLDKSETFAVLSGYKIDMKSVSLLADTVLLTTPYFKSPILGSFMDKSLNELSEGEGAPRFVSFDKRLKINELRESMDYDGGFALEGSRLVGKGTKDNPARLIYKLNNNPLFIISAISFDIDPGKILGLGANLKLNYPNGDSLHHKGGIFQFDEGKNTLFFTADKQGLMSVPFVDNHFKIFCNAPCLKWERNTPFVKFTFEMATSQERKTIELESFSFYDPNLTLKLGGGASNPLVLLANLSKKINATLVTEGQAATALGTTIDYAKSKLLELSSYGLLLYNSKERIIELQPKLFLYAEAFTSETDYDNIKIVSDLTPRSLPNTQEEIASSTYLQAERNKLEILNNRFSKQDFYGFIDMVQDQIFLTGVDQVTLSQAQKVILFPDSTYFRLKPNRDMIFKGDLFVGKFQASLNDAYFSYQDFKVKLNNTSFAGLLAKPLKPEDGSDLIPIVSTFSNLKGELLIDEPLSKSGRSNTNGNFPKLLVPGKVKVVYNDESIVKGAYDSTRFYYLLDPFELDSLDNFHELSQRFKGELISGGIFPPINEPLKIMPDYSLGFSTVAPPGGWAFYGQNSKYENKVILSHNGLQGAGTINFSSATAVSNKLTFLPDSTIGIAKFENKEVITGVQVPSVSSEAAYISFIPKKQVLKASSWREVNLQMFNKQCEMEGAIVLSTSGMRGDGLMHFPDADLGSTNFSYTHEDIHADSSNFTLQNKYVSQGQAPIAMETKDIKAYVSFKTKKGEFNSFGTKRIKFPSNQYYCTMDRFFWYMDKADVDFEKKKADQTTFEAGSGLDEPNFFSMHDDQDTLQFRSLYARYDLRMQTLFCNKVEYIRVGDAKIFPDSMKVVIRKDAVMDPLQNAKIVAPFITKSHTFTEANVSITSRKKYEGNAKYPYYDRDSNITILPLKSIKYLNSVTQAEGEIDQKVNFKLSKEFDYYGKIKIVAASKGIFCEGSTRINHQCTNFDRSWLFFKDTILAKNIQIPISEQAVNDVGRRLAVGFLWKNSTFMDSVKVYPAFLSKMQGTDDQSVFVASGYVQFNPEKSIFQIGSKTQLNGDTDIGNLLTLYQETCSLSGVGEISFGIDLGEVSAKSYGAINFNKESKKISMDLTTLLKFPMQKNVFESIGDGLKKLEGQKNSELKSKQHNFSKAVRFILSEEKVNDLFKDYEEEKLRRMPEALNQTIVLSGLLFDFVHFGSKSSESGFATGWVSRSRVGDKENERNGDELNAKNRASIIAIEGRPVLKDVELNMVVAQTPENSDESKLILKFKNAAEKEYLFAYELPKKNGKLVVYSNEDALKTMITELKPDKRKEKNFSFEWAKEDVVSFIKVRLREYLNAK
jgi:hypothetical protein